MSVRRSLLTAAAVPALSVLAFVVPALGVAPDPECVGSYGAAPSHAGAPIRFGVDPGIAGSVGGTQLPSVPDDRAKDLAALEHLRPTKRTLVVRLNRLDTFGPNPRVVAMTITNVLAEHLGRLLRGGRGALIEGIEAAHREAVKRSYRQLRFGFTYAYRFAPTDDAAFFAHLGVHGGAQFARALGFIGLDFYPGTVYPPVMAPGDTYRHELAQAAGVLRDCLAPMAEIGGRVPIWLTENGVPSGVLSDAEQAAALTGLVRAVHDYSGTFNITDYRWFNLRDSAAEPPATLIGPTFSTDGLLRSDYTHKPSFAEYRSLIARFGMRCVARSTPYRGRR